ncbi:Lrp/AsnC family transcriptional regulator [Rhizobium sp. NFR03]|uniref:Lrp/AsnC family transcriptional regulator n=1 Tax=Rhizobium sp. NFR03 TaxID=1566263 RepID=UPI0008B99372|nr:Lrp/AsnC family transcriptional regulator [Rhizobium sp. NFR03]SES37200.1 DNA-binding transcriptional regulator, Lrp family [Rhizobium sp. NFR03]
MNLSDSDRSLLALLGENARMPTAVLARKLGLSRTTVQARLERLERDGVITGYGVRLSSDYERGLVRAHILVTLAARALPRVTRDLEAMQAVRVVHSVSGSFDLITIVEAPSISALDLVIDRIGTIEGVEKTLSSIVLSTRISR